MHNIITDLERLQEERELLMHEMASADLARATSEAEERHYGSHTHYGSTARRQLTLRIAERFKEKYSKVRRMKAGHGARELVHLRNHLDWNRVAYIGLSIMLDHASVPVRYRFLSSRDRRDKGLMSLTEIYKYIGLFIMTEANLQHLRKKFRYKYAELKDAVFTDHASLRQKMMNMSRQVRGLSDFYNKIANGSITGYQIPQSKAASIAQDFTWYDWPNPLLVQIGSHIAATVNEVSQQVTQDGVGMFDTISTYTDGGKDLKLFTFSQRYLGIKDYIHTKYDEYAYFLLPTLLPPNPWTMDQTEPGGYHYTAKTVFPQLVRGWRQGTQVSQITLDFINRQQEVPFCLDPEILKVQRWLYDNGWSILGEADIEKDSKDSWRPYKRPDEGAIPVLPEKYRGLKKRKGTMPQEDYLKLLNERRVETQRITRFHTRQKELELKSTPVRRFMRTIDKIKNDPAFYFPWYLDWRTRCYPITDSFSPQGPEYQKAVLNFAIETPVDNRTKYWLLVGIGSSAGKDKESFESRYAEGLKLASNGTIRLVATDWKGDGFKVWTSMPEPWIFLRACIEYHRIFNEGQEFTNITCLGQDATQSGLQLLGGMVLDKQTCDLVNCVPGHDKPVDAYGTVLAEAIRLIEEDEIPFPVDRVRGKRKIVKTPVMTKVYACGHDTRIHQIRNALKKEGIRLAQSDEQNEKLIVYFTEKVEEAMLNKIPGVDVILEWFQSVSEAAYDRAKVDLIYHTPSGNKIVNEYRQPITKEVRTETLGSAACDNEKVLVAVGSGEVSPEDGVRAIAANLTHGAGDAALLQLAFHDMPVEHQFVTTHDCVYSPPSKTVDEVHRRVREAFIKICQFGVLQKFAEANGVSDLPPPIFGQYNPKTVRRARYFFS